MKCIFEIIGVNLYILRVTPAFLTHQRLTRTTLVISLQAFLRGDLV
jgi:hypothetical protein